MKIQRFVPISVVALSLLGWALNSIHAHAQFNASTAGVRFSDKKGQCQIEAIKDTSFTLVVFDADHEYTHKSKMDPLSFCHKVQITLDSTYIEGRSIGWSKKMVGADYVAVSAASQIRYRVLTDVR